MGRVLLAGWSLFLIGGFAIAASLQPDPSGFGTHQQLGLPPCTFRFLFGKMCPSCGMTTSFSNFVRGQFVAAARANSAGLLLAIVCTVQIPWCWVSVYRGRLWSVSRPQLTCLWLMLSLAGICLVNWACRWMLN